MTNPWHHLPDEPPFVLPGDAGWIREFNKKASDDHKLCVDELLPEPFVGYEKAPVVVLGNNPGVGQFAPLKMESCFATRMRANLLHQSSDYPFVFLAPDIHENLGVWWRFKLSGLFRHFCDEARATATLAQTILAIEHFPYPSRRYGGGMGRPNLPLEAQKYNFSLVREAMERNAVIVLTRGERRWERDVDGLEKYPLYFKLRNKQRAGITRGNCDGFKEVVKAIEEHQQ
jgi:hypothetical protein